MPHPAWRAVVERDLHEVADRHDADDLPALDDGEMPKPAVDHERGGVIRWCRRGSIVSGWRVIQSVTGAEPSSRPRRPS